MNISFYLYTASKILKIQTTNIITVLDQKLKQFAFSSFMHPKDADGMENSVDPDQTAPKGQSDLSLHCLHKPIYLSF